MLLFGNVANEFGFDCGRYQSSESMTEYVAPDGAWCGMMFVSTKISPLTGLETLFERRERDIFVVTHEGWSELRQERHILGDRIINSAGEFAICQFRHFSLASPHVGRF